MKKTLSTPLALLTLGAAALGLGWAEPPPPAPPPLAEGLPADRSDPPREDAWADAPKVSLARAPEACTARRLREWVRVECGYRPEMGASLISGPREGVSFAHVAFDDRAWTIFPVRRGDRRVIEMLQGVSSPTSFSAYSFEADVAWVISETWLDEEPEPTLVID